MKGRIVVLGTLADRRAAALLVDGRLDDLLIEDGGDRPALGATYRAVADRPMKGQGGIVLKLADGARGFLRQSKGIAPGDALTVQTTGHAEPGKATPVTPDILFKSRFVIVTPGRPGYNVSRSLRDDERRDELLALVHDVAGPPADLGLILRSAAETGSDEDIADDILATIATARAILAEDGNAPELLLDGPDPHALAWRDWQMPDAIETDADAFDRLGVIDAIDALRGPAVELGGEGRMYVEATRAMVTVDVNTGADTSLAAGLKANIAAIRALPAQLRCRGLGGQVTIDLAPMAKKERRTIEQVLRAAFRADSVDTILAGWTPLGCFELQRKRERLPLHETLPKGWNR
ncbi:ribonuclease E/G [Profundibacterium mesophilum]|uniref:Ribonuclease RneRng family protein n=1 Tax=Profundibacterium mesophilum KAUST100406-0324 TaxID=1037889 RepID=A0A921NU77_9RHOB|nr:ribonuclease E/G [Profundibacterium mesophilum]KAF0675648.1 Ribonuclease RneRng family protein [Profundibacterium mesophilum KAUST100406-0324]